MFTGLAEYNYTCVKRSIKPLVAPEEVPCNLIAASCDVTQWLKCTVANVITPITLVSLWIMDSLKTNYQNQHKRAKHYVSFSKPSNHITHNAALTPVNLSDYMQLSLASQQAGYCFFPHML